jgi:hypothetical protein
MCTVKSQPKVFQTNISLIQKEINELKNNFSNKTTLAFLNNSDLFYVKMCRRLSSPSLPAHRS